MWENGCWEKTGSLCHKVVRNGALKSSAWDTRRGLALLLYPVESRFPPAAQSSKKGGGKEQEWQETMRRLHSAGCERQRTRGRMRSDHLSSHLQVTTPATSFSHRRGVWTINGRMTWKGASPSQEGSPSEQSKPRSWAHPGLSPALHRSSPSSNLIDGRRCFQTQPTNDSFVLLSEPS